MDIRDRERERGGGSRPKSEVDYDIRLLHAHINC